MVSKPLLLAMVTSLAMAAPQYQQEASPVHSDGAFGGKYKRRKRLSDADLYVGVSGAPKRQRRKLLKNC